MYARTKRVIGIDEVGRGALAGPVVVAAACIPGHFRPPVASLGPLRDSKKLSPEQRERWFAYFESHPGITFAVAKVYPRQIEKRNISGAANLAASRAHAALVRQVGEGVSGSAVVRAVFLDGGLYLGNGKARQTGRNIQTVIKGDEKIMAVAVASIIAKVTRDRAMRRLARRYPGYGFEVHKGYGTKSHREAIAKTGASAVHRLTFLGKTPIIQG